MLKSKQKTKEDVSTDELIPGEEPSVANNPDAKILLDQVLVNLSPDERELVELHGRGLTWVEIADELNVTPTVIYQRWYRLKGKIRDGRME